MLMSRSARALIQIGISLILALGTGVLIFMWTSGVARQPVAAPRAETVPVVVALTDLRPGTKLTAAMLETRGFTPDSRPSGAFGEPGLLAGRVLGVAVGANEAVTEAKLADASVVGGGVSALIEPGKRAMSVKGNAVMGLAGFVRPGDRVDVVVSLVQGRGNQDEPVTKLVLERVKVLATGTELQAPDTEGKAASVDVYTLELTPEESERLALAATQGTLNFALRNATDTDKVLTDGVTVNKALAALRPIPKPAPVRRNQVSVEVITGGETRTLKF
jgi:pilus assembly protein CpaB